MNISRTHSEAELHAGMQSQRESARISIRQGSSDDVAALDLAASRDAISHATQTPAPDLIGKTIMAMVPADLGTRISHEVLRRERLEARGQLRTLAIGEGIGRPMLTAAMTRRRYFTNDLVWAMRSSTETATGENLIDRLGILQGLAHGLSHVNITPVFGTALQIAMERGTTDEFEAVVLTPKTRDVQRHHHDEDALLQFLDGLMDADSAAEKRSRAFSAAILRASGPAPSTRLRRELIKRIGSLEPDERLRPTVIFLLMPGDGDVAANEALLEALQALVPHPDARSRLIKRCVEDYRALPQSYGDADTRRIRALDFYGFFARRLTNDDDKASVLSDFCKQLMLCQPSQERYSAAKAAAMHLLTSIENRGSLNNVLPDVEAVALRDAAGGSFGYVSAIAQAFPDIEARRRFLTECATRHGSEFPADALAELAAAVRGTEDPALACLIAERLLPGGEASVSLAREALARYRGPSDTPEDAGWRLYCASANDFSRAWRHAFDRLPTIDVPTSAWISTLARSIVRREATLTTHEITHYVKPLLARADAENSSRARLATFEAVVDALGESQNPAIQGELHEWALRRDDPALKADALGALLKSMIRRDGGASLDSLSASIASLDDDGRLHALLQAQKGIHAFAGKRLAHSLIALLPSFQGERLKIVASGNLGAELLRADDLGSYRRLIEASELHRSSPGFAKLIARTIHFQQATTFVHRSASHDLILSYAREAANARVPVEIFEAYGATLRNMNLRDLRNRVGECADSISTNDGRVRARHALEHPPVFLPMAGPSRYRDGS